ncbi:hypothetical protein NBZ79_17515 [Sneathiella marina]|uniref:DUF2846 domain-containing protein n=1 Tax=Sneathiella marina TaxID=2950108 RepID=A0ABY4W274_9PROT|nr:hypothetical protein [Sneathiella marina]USG60959.1 hypothetical protein NBZ79_17515 [Sneathiella marina]
MKSTLVSLFFLFVLTACATPKLDGNFKYAADNPKGMIAVLDYRVTQKAQVTIRRIEINKSRILGKAYVLGRRGTVSTPAYHLMEIPAGTYVVVAITTSSRIGYTRYVKNRCYTPALEIFEVQPGTVNSVEIGKLAAGKNVKSPDLEKILRPYPGITAPIRQAKLRGYASVKGISCKSLMRDDVDVKILVNQPKKLTIADMGNQQRTHN